MSVAIPVTTPPELTPQLTTLWELGSDLQAETSWIARLSERLDTEDDDERALAIADLEASLALEDNKREAFLRKADATCWVIERLRAEANYYSGQSKRFSALAKREDNRADALESTLIHLLSRLDPSATAHNLLDHRLTSRTTEAIEIDDPDLLPPDLLTTKPLLPPTKPPSRPASAPSSHPPSQASPNQKPPTSPSPSPPPPSPAHASSNAATGPSPSPQRGPRNGVLQVRAPLVFFHSTHTTSSPWPSHQQPPTPPPTPLPFAVMAPAGRLQRSNCCAKR